MKKTGILCDNCKKHIAEWETWQLTIRPPAMPRPCGVEICNICARALTTAELLDLANKVEL